MGRKNRKRRTHVDDEVVEKTGGEKVPKSFVVRRFGPRHEFIANNLMLTQATFSCTEEKFLP
jgi:hypothetical protein